MLAWVLTLVKLMLSTFYVIFSFCYLIVLLPVPCETLAYHEMLWSKIIWTMSSTNALVCFLSHKMNNANRFECSLHAYRIVSFVLVNQDCHWFIHDSFSDGIFIALIPPVWIPLWRVQRCFLYKRRWPSVASIPLPVTQSFTEKLLAISEIK